MDAIPELLYLSNDELKELINCEDKLKNFVEGLPDLAPILKSSQQLVEKNLVLAKENLETKSEYEKIRDTTINKVEELSTIHANFDKLLKQHQQISEKLAPSNLQETILIHAAQSEEESENIAEAFLDKNIEIAPFLCQYLDKRIESHQRKFKGDKLGMQLIELQKAGF